MKIEKLTQHESDGTFASHQVMQVTPTSKYLAMLLFLILPFLGGWIGFQNGYISGSKYKAETPTQKVINETTHDKLASSNFLRLTDRFEIGGVEYWLENPEPTGGSDGFWPAVLQAKDLNSKTSIAVSEYSSLYSQTGSNSIIINNGIGHLLKITDSGDLEIISLMNNGTRSTIFEVAEGLSLQQQFVCELGCVQQMSWSVEPATFGKTAIVVELSKAMTYEELVKQFQTLYDTELLNYPLPRSNSDRGTAERAALDAQKRLNEVDEIRIVLDELE